MYMRQMSGMLLPGWAFKEQFDPRRCPKQTYLLCELQWNGGVRSWTHWVRNEDEDNGRHAEQYFLEEIFEPRSSRLCDMTWYMSWSPCHSCSDKIQDFLETHPNVNIDIRAARVYYQEDAITREALRDLDSLEEVTIEVMEARDYTYCWNTFIEEDDDDDFSPRNFRPAIQRNRSMLESILRNPYF